MTKKNQETKEPKLRKLLKWWHTKRTKIMQFFETDVITRLPRIRKVTEVENEETENPKSIVWKKGREIS